MVAKNNCGISRTAYKTQPFTSLISVYDAFPFCIFVVQQFGWPAWDIVKNVRVEAQ